MFGSASKRNLSRSARAAAAVTTSGLVMCSLTTLKLKSECEDVTNPCYGHDKGSSRRPFRVLIVGSGLTGSLTALRIRQRLHGNQTSATDHPATRPRDVDLTVAERATYPAGRFGAAATHRDCVADIGAQVLSTINPKDYRALGGHGVTIENIQTSSEIVQALKSDGVISRVDDSKLGETEERMLWEDLWHHYSAPTGMRGVLVKLLSWANVRPHFGVRVDKLNVSNDRTIQVKGVYRTENDSEQGAYLNKVFIKNYDCVVLCIPAPNVLELGVVNYLSPMSRHVLENVRYDRRTCEAHFFSKEFGPRLAEVFGEKIELMLDDEADSAIQYISWQNPKRANSSFNDSGTCAIVAHGAVAHGRAGKLQPLSQTLDSALSKLTGMPEGEISLLRLHTKSIPWNVSQMIMPMEAVVADPPSPAWQCLVGKKGPSEGIIIAGDFITQSSFVGCVATADAAAKAVVERANSDGNCHVTRD